MKPNLAGQRREVESRYLGWLATKEVECAGEQCC
jgi:hypothetical protein